MLIDERVRLSLFGISDDEATFERRGFPLEPPAVARLEGVGRTFLGGYRTALRLGCPSACAEALNQDVARVDVGFAFEGAAMAFALLDALTPWRRNRIEEFLRGPGAHHAYMIHVGAGWALARVQVGGWQRWRRMDTLLRWLVVDGFGFHEGYFHPARYLNGDNGRIALTGYRRRAFDQGLGRAAWFASAADGQRIVEFIETKEQARRADLWSGVGLAAAYAGGGSPASLEQLATSCGPYLPHVAQGACFAAEARRRASNPSEHTRVACRVLCGVSSEVASDLVLEKLAGLTDPESEDAYERWRSGVRSHFDAD